ncbi:hypothetical protein [Geodermatophilus nigrescens]
MARAHRRVGEAEHRVEEALLRRADNASAPPELKAQAHRISRRADRHLDHARRLSEDDES